MSNKRKIFITYAREDREKVEVLYEQLQSAGFEPWMDIRSIRPGERWQPVMQHAIQEADFILVCLSTNSINKMGFVQKEINVALNYAEERIEGSIFLIPVRLDDCSIPASLSKLQFVDLFKEGEWNKLLRAFQVGAEQRNAIAHVSKEISIERKRKPKKSLFVAMPFSLDMEDRFFYGMQRAADATGFSCDRVDKDAFTGDILKRIKDGIDNAIAVVADLTTSNPNVYLEVGYAWGIQKPTILLIQDVHELCFDVRGQRCLKYSSIRNLEEILTSELEELKSKDII
jgi:hypothetical protein